VLTVTADIIQHFSMERTGEKTSSRLEELANVQQSILTLIQLLSNIMAAEFGDFGTPPFYL
jgi:hypothetical protein